MSYSYDRRATSTTAAAKFWRPKAQVVEHRALKGLGDFWEGKLGIAVKSFQDEQKADGDVIGAAEYLSEVGQVLQHDISYLAMVLKDVRNLRDINDRTLNQALQWSRM